MEGEIFLLWRVSVKGKGEKKKCVKMYARWLEYCDKRGLWNLKRVINSLYITVRNFHRNLTKHVTGGFLFSHSVARLRLNWIQLHDVIPVIGNDKTYDRHKFTFFFWLFNCRYKSLKWMELNAVSCNWNFC